MCSDRSDGGSALCFSLAITSDQNSPNCCYFNLLSIMKVENSLNEEMERFWNNLIITWQNPLLNAIPEEAIYATLEWGIKH